MAQVRNLLISSFGPDPNSEVTTRQRNYRAPPPPGSGHPINLLPSPVIAMPFGSASPSAGQRAGFIRGHTPDGPGPAFGTGEPIVDRQRVPEWRTQPEGLDRLSGRLPGIHVLQARATGLPPWLERQRMSRHGKSRPRWTAVILGGSLGQSAD